MRPEIQGSDSLQNSLLRDRILADEIKLTQEVVEAMCETDIMLLRNGLKKAARQASKSSLKEHAPDGSAFFGLSDEIIAPVDLIFENQESEIGNFLQQLHMKNHSFASKEVVHDLFSEVEENLEIDDLVMSSEDEFLFEELREAVTEKEVIDLRACLQSISQSVSKHAFVFEETDDLISGEFDNVLESLIQEDSRISAVLSSEMLHQEEIEKAIAELDIMKLRADLKGISQMAAVKETRILHLASPGRKMLFWSAAASIAVLIAFSALLQPKGISDQELYASYYQPYKNGAVLSRSGSTSTSLLSLALREIDREDFTTALNLLKIASADKIDGFAANFYTGEVYQKLGDYKSAIKSFNEVVQHGDNLLVEQSQWFIGLCYLKMNEKAEAANQFRSIVASKGYYSEKSRDLLKQLN
jgi:tetratricopeptide (TPR) repeat protein